jgi:cyclophilin family peptidyl-prolyl cis-trans isomerase
MRWLTLKLRNLLAPRSQTRPGLRTKHTPPKRRLELEMLENRCVPAGTTTGSISGTAFIDGNGNGHFDAGEPTLPGVPVFLAGTTTQGTAINVNVTTDTNGNYVFTNVLPGTYQMSAGPEPGVIGGSASFGAQSAPAGMDFVGNFTVSAGQSVIQNFGFGGVTPDLISLREFLTTTTGASFPFPPGGSGSSPAGPRANSAPFVAAGIGDISVGKNASPAVLDLAGVYSDPDITDTKVRFDVSAGSFSGTINVELFDKQAPRTVANFLNYIKSGAYNNSIFHRLVTNFVLQGGGFTFNSAKATLDTIPTDPPVQNEPDVVNRSNTIGTIAMAKLGSDPNSATDQFFFNLGDNSSNLNNQNGGFTVFGKIVSADDQNTINALAGATIRDESKGDASSPFNSIPLNSYNGTNFPTDTTAANYDLVKDVQIISQTESLTYSVVGNSNPGLVTTAIKNNRLTLTYAANATGTSTITVRATDEFGATVDDTFHVSVANQAPTATVTLSSPSPTVNGTLTATAKGSDPDGDPVTFTYAWSVNGNVVKTTSSTASTTDTLNLSQVPNIKKGDTVKVTVTPSDGQLNGAAASDTVTVADAPPTATVSLNTTSPMTNDTLTATATGADADGDPVTFTYSWAVNGNVVQTTTGDASKTNTFDLSQANHGNKGDRITVTVTPNDGTLNGTAVSATATVVNSPPAVSVSFNTTSPAAGTTLTATAVPSDPDSDSVTLTYVWKVNGNVVKTTSNTPNTTDSLDLSQPGNGTTGDTVTVTVTPNDGTANGTPATATAVIA